MMPVVKLDEQGRFRVPYDLLDALGLKPGDEMTIELGREGATLSLSSLRPTLSGVSGLRNYINRKNLETPVRFVKGVGPKMAELLARKGITTVEDAIYHLPVRYEDRRSLRRICDLRPGCFEVFHAEVRSSGPVVSRNGRRFFEVHVGDESGAIVLKWFNFNPRFMKGVWRPGRRGIFTGEIIQYGSKREIHHPEVDWLGDDLELSSVMAADPVNFGRTVPVYPLTEGLKQRALRKVLKEVVDIYATSVETCIPQYVMERQSLMPLSAALSEAHFPGDLADLDALNSRATSAHRTLAFDEFFFFQLGLAVKRRGSALEEGIPFRITHKYTRLLLKLLPFSLTEAQKRVLTEIKEDLAAPHPMCRLVQGDVGSGKTIVALFAALLAVENDCQAVIMAPTEVLAEQHYLNIHRYCEELDIQIRLLTAGVKGKDRSSTLAAVASGEVRIVVGTHAVIQEKVEFSRLGLGIIDEQHRFGVLQRGILKRKGINPHILVMTATPIPRTLAMTVFGDLSLSVIDELPRGRSPVTTRICFEAQRHRVYQLIREEVGAGRQAYIIYPLVEESEKSELRAAAGMAEHLAAEIFPDLRVGLLHGRLKPEEKESVMRSFKSGDIHILVATTVVEVGIDVPNATVMVVEHAERFGLSQLHQLRGRVGRGTARSRCILMAGDGLSDDGKRRLKVMEETADGFRIAEADLELRGPGDFIGTRQAGLPEFRVASILRDGKILEEARREAFEFLERDPALTSGEGAILREELARRWGKRLELAGVA